MTDAREVKSPLGQLLEHTDSLREAVYLTVGAASVCWVDGTGDSKFDGEQADAVAKALIEWVEGYYVPGADGSDAN